ncbi:glycerophosphodiester phosphodiesterase [Cohnella cellulosilytica]|uniref:Glycerophosphodiester phosphodiesterase n=1 Tax=Cohnella cellulosilytica TaxID=986710 RepID=A0ABW2F8U6_9BACL
MNDFPLITAHTGCMGTPDNSAASAETGIAHGADIVEDDIRATRDGTLVLSHDDGITFADGTEGSLSGMTLAELNARLAKPLQLLEPVLKSVADAGRRMNLDVKADDVIEPLSDLIERLGLLDRVFLSGCQFPRAIAVSECNPRLGKLLNVDVNAFIDTPYPDAIKKLCEQALAAGCFGVNLPYQIVRPSLMEAARDVGLDVYVWTVNEEPQMRMLAGMGVRSITTRNVDVLARLKRNWSLEGQDES